MIQSFSISRYRYSTNTTCFGRQHSRYIHRSLEEIRIDLLVIGHELLQPCIPSNPAPNLLSIDPHGNSQCTAKQEHATQSTEHNQDTILFQPSIDKIRKSKGQEITSIDRDENLLTETRVAVNHVTENAGRRKRHGHVCETEAEDGAGPVGLVVNRGAEAEEADTPQDGGEDDEGQTKFGLVDTAVFVGEVHADPVVHGAGDDFADEGEDEGGETDEAGLGDGEVVGGFDEDDTVDDGEDDYTHKVRFVLCQIETEDVPIQVRVVP